MDDLLPRILNVVVNIGLIYVLLFFTILIHEAGHYFAMDCCDVKVEHMCIGIGPALYGSGKTPEDSWFLIRLFPLGGGVRIDDEGFDNKSLPAQFFMLGAGVLANAWIIAILGADSISGFFRLLLDVFLACFFLLMSAIDTLLNKSIWDLSPLSMDQMDFVSSNNAIAEWFVKLNLSIIAFNMLPIPPLDGGRMCLSVLGWIFPKSIAKPVGIVVMIIGAIYLFIQFIFSIFSWFR
jgi:regulator of sigma E protease